MYTPEQYNDFYLNSPVHRMGFREFDFYKVWEAAAHQVIAMRAQSVTDLGCGPGHFAATLFGLGWNGVFLGEDFSYQAIRMAQGLHLGSAAMFTVKDIREGHQIVDDAVTAFEVFEHIDDLAPIFSRIQPQTPILFSVPNHEGFGHIRTFSRPSHVKEFFRPWVSIESFKEFRFQPKETFWLGTGKVRESSI